MEAEMKVYLKPFRMKMSRRMAKRVAESLSQVGSPPMEKLQKEAQEFEQLMLKRRAANTGKSK